MTLRVGLSLLTLVPGVSGGTESFVRSLAEAFGRGGRNEYTAYVPSIAPDVALPLRSVGLTEYPAAWSIGGRLAAMALGTFAGRRVGRRILADAPDVLHYPVTIHVPRIRARAIVTTLHDLQHEALPQLFSAGERAYRHVAYADAVRRSDAIVTISDYSKDAIMRRYGCDPSRVKRIYSGVDHARFRPAAVSRQPFLFYPANAWAHKNHARLFAAFEMLREQRPDLELVLTGTGHDTLLLPPGVRSLGRVSIDDVARLYQTAALLVFPSLYEGFGLPVLEAMASACPVAASRTTSIPEVAGDTAVLFEPTDVRAMADAILAALSPSEARIEAARARAQEFSWAKTASQYDDVYSDVARSGR